MDPRPCIVVEGADRWPGQVLTWVRDGNGWHAVVRYTRTSPEGWPLTYEHALPADCLEPSGVIGSSGSVG